MNSFICIFLIIIFFIFISIKNYTTSKNRSIIINAILDYNHDQIEKYGYSHDCNLISCNNMEPYDKTLFRIWDFGYKHILPKEYFIKIKPYIKKNDWRRRR